MSTYNKDVQASTEGFKKIAINKVGVRNIEIPVWVLDHDSDYISSIANVSSYCDLVESVKGIHMSRILRTINEVFLPERKEIITSLATEVVMKLREAQGAEEAFFKAKFKYPLYQHSPSTNLSSPEIINVTIETVANSQGQRKFMTVELVGMSLCPCSKEMSLLRNNITEEEFQELAKLPIDLQTKVFSAGFGAHNQKSFVKVTVELSDEFINIEDIVDIINNSVSARTFSVLKRPDEKYVTEVSYLGGYYDENFKFCEVKGTGPKFVEDIVRDVANILNGELDKRIKDYVVVVRNQESIHSNDIEAVAILNAGRYLK